MTATKRRRRSGNPARPAPPVYRPQLWHRDHRYAFLGIVGATALTLLAGFLGPSAVTLTLGPRTNYLPPWYLPAGVVDPNEWFVSILIWAAIIVGALGLWVGMRALADGWKPRLRRLFALGTTLSLLTITVPPLTSADVLMYAAYGRLQAIGRNPYEITPAEVFRGQFDPVLRWTERPWWDTPSVYGPITSWTQWFANKLGGENMHNIVFWLQLVCVLTFIVACAGVVMLAHGDPRRQARATLLTVANPVLIWAVVAGAHNEALSVMFAVVGLMFMRKNPFLAGLGIGLAGCAKLSIGIWGLAMLWAYRREPKKAALLCLGTAVPMVLAYVVWQPTAFFQVLRNGGYVSVGSWANPVFRFLDLFMTGTQAKVVVGVISYSGLFVVGWMLSRVVPWTAAPGLEKGADLRKDPLTIALRTALVLSVAWLITSMYTLSWYDLIAWMPLAVLAASKLDKIMLMRIAPLSLAYVPGRAVDVGAALDLTATRMRDTVSPIVQWLVLLAVVLWWRQPKRPELFPFAKRDAAAPTPAAPAEPRTPSKTGARSALIGPGPASAGVGPVGHRPLQVALDLARYLRLERVGGERRGHRAPGEPGDTGLVQTQQARGDRVLGVQVGAEHRRVVGVDADPYAGVDQRADRVAVQVGDDLEGDVGGRADVEGDLVLGQVLEQPRISDGGDAVLDPLGVQRRDRVPDGLRAGGLARVRHAVQARRTGPVELRGEHRAREAALGAPDAESHQPRDVVVQRRGGGDLGRGQAEVGGDVEDPGQLDPVVAPGRGAGVLDGFEEGLDRHPLDHRQVGRHRQLGVADLLRGHLRADLVGQQPHVLGLADQVHDGDVVADEVGEVVEDVEVAQLVGIRRHGSRMPLGQLRDDPGRGGSDLVHVQLGLGQARDESRRDGHRISLSPRTGR